ncbi:hypothetical protein QTP86_010343 [Hemibagrus guttatus]|nr:hypothetical protein QTP86_010343 [Hemibagrus guttatus]
MILTSHQLRTLIKDIHHTQLLLSSSSFGYSVFGVTTVDHPIIIFDFGTGEDTFELHSLDLELEAVEKQIRNLQVKQAQLRQQKTMLESSRTDTHLSQVPAILNKNIGAVVHHASTNDTRLRQTEMLKKDFRTLVEKKLKTSSQVHQKNHT